MTCHEPTCMPMDGCTTLACDKSCSYRMALQIISSLPDNPYSHRTSSLLIALSTNEGSMQMAYLPSPCQNCWHEMWLQSMTITWSEHKQSSKTLPHTHIPAAAPTALTTTQLLLLLLAVDCCYCCCSVPPLPPSCSPSSSRTASGPCQTPGACAQV